MTTAKSKFRILEADILTKEIFKKADAICFTSNGVVKTVKEKVGPNTLYQWHLVMGKGNALAFKKKFPVIDQVFGTFIAQYGNKVYWAPQVNTSVEDNDYKCISVKVCNFPTKNHWKDKSDIGLIRESAKQLMELIERQKWTNVYLPAPGIGNGGLDWADVEKVLEETLDERVIVTFKF